MRRTNSFEKTLMLGNIEGRRRRGRQRMRWLDGITNPWSLRKLMSIESVMPSNHLILCRPLVLLPSIFPSIRVFSNELALHIRWPNYWSFSFNISLSNEHSGLISLRIKQQQIYVCVCVCVCVCMCIVVQFTLCLQII